MSKLPNKKTQFSEWYLEVINQAELVDQAPVRGCMVVRPYGNDIWEMIKGVLDKKIKDTGHRNALFPLLIPESFLKKEAAHIEGFAPELAVVTHAGGKLLAEPLVVRPTSETIIHYMFARWIKSWRDLPLKINQWASVVRWEMRPRPFLRTTEFFWQEGHTAHASREEAEQEVLLMLSHYKDLAENYLAIPVITGQKSEGEKFPGAEKTYTFEAFMPDAKALQMGTSHLLSQSFAHAFEMTYQDVQGKLQYPWLTSWGSTTRLVGAVVMVHGDDKGLIIPPRIAPVQVVIVPIYKTDEEKTAVLFQAQSIKDRLANTVRITIDTDEHKTPGNKFYHWELRGIPLRIEIGPRDLSNKQAVCADRLGTKETVLLSDLETVIPQKLDALHHALYARAEVVLNTQWIQKDTLQEIIDATESAIIQTGFCGSKECETVLKEYKLSIRCLLEQKKHSVCFKCTLPNTCDAVIARSY